MKYISIAAAGIFLITTVTSCKENQEKEAQVNENEEVQRVRDSADLEKARYADSENVQIEKPVMPDNYEINWDKVDADPKMKIDIENWADLKTFSSSVRSLGLDEIADEEIVDYVTRLEQEANNLSKSIPKSMMTEEIQEDIKDIKEEVRDLKAITVKYGADKNKISNQVEELVEAYDDLNEEIKETASKTGKSILDDNQ